jgi:cation diffusion facilitator family transporter
LKQVTDALTSRTSLGKKIAGISIAVSLSLAIAKITIGLLGRSTSVVADGFESAGDVIASTIVLFGFVIAARPPDKNHPYGHGKYETLTGLIVGLVLAIGGVGISYKSLSHVAELHPPPAAFAIWPLLASMVSKGILSAVKFHYGRRIGSSSLRADAWNDFVDIISAIAALTALGLTLLNPNRFLAADHYGGFAVGVIVIFTGLRVAKETTEHLTDTMPSADLMNEIRTVALSVPGALGVEKLFARNAGLSYYVDLHLEVSPQLTVRQSHEIANEVRFAIRRKLEWVADVLVHVEPWPGPDTFGSDK